MTRDWAAEYQAKYEQRFADQAQVAYEEYAAREQKRRQMREPVEPLRGAPWWQAFAVLMIILLILHAWDHDIYFR